MNYRIVDLGSPTFNFSMMNILEKRPCTEKDKEYLLKEKLVWYNNDPDSEWQKHNKDMLCCDSDIDGVKIYNYLTKNEITEYEFNQYLCSESSNQIKKIFGKDIFKLCEQLLKNGENK